MSYPKVSIEAAKTDVIEIKREALVSVSNVARFAEIRTYGEFAEKAIFLNSSYIWVIGYDSHGVLIAIPTRSI